ncbi:hypothetical protein ACFU53_26240 [Streptomyces sp. NPDC057474]|uniref:hypothetical protein n=1 Tax=Streptomyces sp. NPDC057474 TaxID=3346144 RepID=UPI0036D13D90
MLQQFVQFVGGLNSQNPKNWILAVRCLRGLLKEAGSAPHPSLVNTPKAVLP